MIGKLKIKQGILGLLLLAGVMACNDEFNNHYSPDEVALPEETLWQIIEQNENLSVFADMLRQTGYDVILSGDQAYTVWAPENEALRNVDKTNLELVANIVKTHIARFSYSTTAHLDKNVLALSNKRLPFEQTVDNKFTIKGVELNTANNLAKNGILHTLNEQIPYLKNIWELLDEPGMDSVRNYFYSFYMRQFLPGSSAIIDYQNGMPVYDSIFVEWNDMWNLYRGVGYLNNEDSLYTMILPDNNAWINAYNERKGYFETQAPNSDSLQHANTQYAIVQNLVFRGNILTPPADSIISTQGNVFRNPAQLFPATHEPASNGIIYKTGELKQNAWEAWQTPLAVQAERTNVSIRENYTPALYGESKVNLRWFSDKPDIPSMYCVYAISPNMMSASDPAIVLFEIPNTLKATYNVYAVFAPMRYLYPEQTKERAKINFDIQQLDRSTVDRIPEKRDWKSLIQNNPTSAFKTYGTAAPGDNTTDSVTVKKIFLAKIDFSEANINEKVNTIRVKLATRASATDISRNDFRNRMLVDYILLEPVHN
jgi:hypothetical protein